MHPCQKDFQEHQDFQKPKGFQMLQKLHGNKENEETIIDGDQDISWPKNGIKASIPEHDSKVGGRLMLFKKAWESAPRWQRTVVCYGAGWKFIQIPPTQQK